MHRPSVLFLAALMWAAGVSSAASNVSDEFYGAVRNNDPARLNSLTAGGADVNNRDHLEKTPLMYAAYVGSLDAMNLLLAHGAASGGDERPFGCHRKAAH
jgi:ankyrin repeat protein